MSLLNDKKLLTSVGISRNNEQGVRDCDCRPAVCKKPRVCTGSKRQVIKCKTEQITIHISINC